MIYRVNTQMIGAAGAAFALGGLVLLLRLSADDMPGGGLVAVGVGYVLFVGWMMVLLIRSSTTIADEGVIVRNTRNTTVHPWAEIADIRFELVATGRVTMRGAVLYDARLRRIVLPYVNDRRLGGTPAAERATTELRERWEAARGPGWQPRTAEVERKVATRQGRSRLWAHVLIALCGGFVLAIVIVVVVLLTASTEFVDTDLFGAMPLLILILPALAFATTAIVELLRRRS